MKIELQELVDKAYQDGIKHIAVAINKFLNDLFVGKTVSGMASEFVGEEWISCQNVEFTVKSVKWNVDFVCDNNYVEFISTDDVLYEFEFELEIED